VVALVTWTALEAPGASEPKEQASVCGLVPVIAQGLGLPVGWLWMLQVTPVPLGSGSETVTPAAVPVPVALLLLAVIVYPIWSPALTVALSAALLTERLGHCTVIEAEAVAGGLLLAVTLAEFE
jgi:hypothetical protein